MRAARRREAVSEECAEHALEAGGEDHEIAGDGGVEGADGFGEVDGAGDLFASCTRRASPFATLYASSR